MPALGNTLSAQRRKDLRVTLIASGTIALMITYLVFSWGTGYPNVSAVGLWATVAIQGLLTFLLFGPALETKRWHWWKVSWTLTGIQWSIGLALGFAARIIF